MEYTISSSKCNYINEGASFVDSVFTTLSLQTNDGTLTRHGLLQFPLPFLVKSNIVWMMRLTILWICRFVFPKREKNMLTSEAGRMRMTRACDRSWSSITQQLFCTES